MLKIVSTVLVLGLAMAAPAAAFHRKTATLLQITPDGPGTISNPRWSGYRYVVFDSDGDVLGNGSTGRQVFMFDLQARDLTGTLSIRELTSGPGDNRHGSTGTRGKAVVYDTAPGGAGPRQIMLVSTSGGGPTPLTHGSADSVNPVMDDSGQFVAFESQADLLGSGFTGSQIYLLDLRLMTFSCPYPCPATGNAGLTQLTHKSGTSTNPVLNKRAKVVAFESNADLLSAGETETQIYRVDIKSGTMTRPSRGPGASHHPTVSKDGNLVAFASDADLLGNGSTGTQIFLYRQATGVLKQITDANGTASSDPSMETTGRGLLFVSNADLARNGTTGEQVYQYDVTTEVLHQVTKTSSTTSDPAYSAGVFTVFLSDGDLLNNGSTGRDLYLVNLFKLQTGTIQ